MELLWEVKYISFDDRNIEIKMLGSDKDNVILQLAMYHNVKRLISVEEVR